MSQEPWKASGPYMWTAYFVRRGGREKEKKEERKEEERRGKEGRKFTVERTLYPIKWLMNNSSNNVAS